MLGRGVVSEEERSNGTLSSVDSVEKQPIVVAQEKEDLQVYTHHRLHESRFSWFWRASYAVDKFGETRGLERQSPDARQRGNFWHFLRLTGVWFGATLTLPSMTGFFMGPLGFGLSFRSSMSAGLLGVFVGTVASSFGAVMGPRSGLRAMIGTKYQFGWWFSKFIALLNALTLIGWLMVNANFGGQMLNAIANVDIEVGIAIMFIVSTVLALFGMRLLVIFDTFFMVPIFVAFLLCYVCAGHEFEVHQHSTTTGVDLVAKWLCFFQSCIGITSTWIGIASDYYIDLPENSNGWFIYFFTLFSIFLPTAFVGILGIGLGSAALYNDEKKAIYNKNGGAGLIWDSMARWHGGGKFLVVLMYISLITNGGLSNYSLGLSLQSLAKPLARTPRYVLVFFTACVYYVLSAVGKDGWYEVIENFLPMIGYWSMIYSVILVIETFWFRRRKINDYQWDEYLNYKHFPVLYASVLAFGFGVAGVVIGMDQYYYVGRLARLIGSEENGGAELGTLLAVGFTAVSYVPLRYLELRWRNETPIRP